MRRSIVRVLLACAASACTAEQQQPSEGEAVAVASTTAALTKGPSTGDDGSLQAIIVHYDDARSEQLGKRTLDAVVENTTDKALDVTLEIAALDQSDSSKELSRALGVRAVAAHSSITVAIAIDQIPVQTVGGDSPVWVRASYGIDADTALTGRKPLRQVAVSEMRAVTFDDGFKTAAVRDAVAQLAQNGRIGDAKRVTAKRGFDKAAGRLRDQTPSDGMLSSRLVPKGAPNTPPMPANEGVAP